MSQESVIHHQILMLAPFANPWWMVPARDFSGRNIPKLMFLGALFAMVEFERTVWKSN